MRRRPVVVSVVLAGAAAVGGAATHSSAAPAWQRWDAMASLRLDGDKLCSGAIVRLPDSQPGDKALLLSAGHCIPDDRPKPGVVVTERATDARANTAALHRGSNDDDHSQPFETGISRVVYATMTGSDIALMQVNATYADLSRRGIKPRTIANREAPVGTMVAVPSAQFGDPFEGCRITSVGVTKQVKPWSWSNLMEVAGDSCMHMREGASGSPIIGESDGLVYGEANMVSDGKDGVQRVYGPSARPLLRCISRGRFTAQGCTLAKP